MSSLGLAQSALASALGAALLSLLLAAYPVWVRRLVFLSLALSGLLAVAGGLQALFTPAQATMLPIGLPWLSMHLRLDALGGFFLLTIGLLVFAVALYSVGYTRKLGKHRSIVSLTIFMSLFIAAMMGVVLADDAYTYMIFWELMSVTSYFLVVFNHEQMSNRKAGFIYLLMAQLGGLLILGAFAVLYAAGSSFEFSTMRTVELTPLWASVAFLLAAFGFGMKAGVVPLHVWLPEAHPAAPSNVSALMSGVMLKVAIFGFLRLVWDLIGLDQSAWWWGALVLAAGSSSAVSGVLLALQQHHLKRLLAYHSVENIGIIAIGMGLGMIFAYFDHPLLAALGLLAALYHTINHALFKGLLFLGAGAVLHATHSNDMEKMGGLIHRMPRTAVLFLVACISISALPPFNGFVSEWLTFQAALMAPQLEGTLLSALIPFSAAMLALAGALAATCFVKVYGIVFLGRARDPVAAEAHEVDGWMQLGMAFPAVLCLLLGVFPTLVLPVLDAVPQLLLQHGLADALHEGGWLWLTPLAGERASYAAPIVILAILAILSISFLVLRRRGGPVRRGPVWSCGFPGVTAQMQYTAVSFSQPLRRIFASVYRPREKYQLANLGHKMLTKRVRYTLHIMDLSWQYVYLPIGKLTLVLTQWVQWLHSRTLNTYLSYSFVTLLIILGLI